MMGGCGGWGPRNNWVLSRTGLILACSHPGAGLGWPSRAKDVTKPNPLIAVKGRNLEGRACVLGTWKEGAWVSFPSLSLLACGVSWGKSHHLSEFREMGATSPLQWGSG